MYVRRMCERGKPRGSWFNPVWGGGGGGVGGGGGGGGGGAPGGFIRRARVGQSETAGHRSSARMHLSLYRIAFTRTYTPTDTRHTQRECRGAPVVRRGDARVAPPCPTTSCVEKFTLPYLTLQRDGPYTYGFNV